MHIIHPGATETHSFVIPFDINTISKVIVTYEQEGYNVFEKEMNDKRLYFTELENNKTKIEFTFTQDESLKFIELTPCKIQVNVINGNGTSRYVSNVIDCRCGEQLHEEVIVNDNV